MTEPRPLPALIGLAFNRLVEGILEQVHAAGHPEIQPHHLLHIFRFLGPEGARPARLAEQAGVTAQAISLVISDLERLGYVLREPDTTDRRATVIRYSERGFEAGMVIERWYSELQARWVARHGAADVMAAQRVLASAAGIR